MITNTRLLAIALMLAGSVAGCDGNKPEEVVQALNVLAGRVDALEAKPVAPDYTQGAAIINEIVAAEIAVPSDAAGEPVALIAAAEPVVVPEPVAPVSHVVCPDPIEWRGQLIQNPCWLEYGP